MGIHTHIDPLDADELGADAMAAADELLASVLSDYAQERVREANRANKAVAGEYIPFSVSIDGKKVYEGRGEILPENQIAAFKPQAKSRRERQREANVRFGRQVKQIVVEWFWDRVNDRLLTRAIETLLRIRRGYHTAEDLAEFASILGAGGPDAAGLLKYLIERWLARKTRWFRVLQDARAVYRVYRLLRLIASGRGGDGDSADDEQDDVLRWIARELVDRSPVLSGAYREAHTLYADGNLVGSAAEVAAGGELPMGTVFVFVNAAPYARKIEVGKTADGGDFVIQVPNRIYERVAEDAATRFDAIATIRSEWRDEGSYPVLVRGAAGRELRYPAIVVRMV